MFEAMFWGGVLRGVSALLQASPTILVGLLVAGVFRHLLGYENTRRLFGGTSTRGLVQAWLIGMLLPVCSLGVIPCLREMKRAGLPGGTILAFALAAPLFNPLSLLYGLTLSEPMAIIVFAGCSLVIVTGVGLLWDKLFPGTGGEPEAIKVVPPGLKRMLSIPIVAARELVGPSLAYMLLGLLGVFMLAAALPPCRLQNAAEHSDPFAPLFMSLVALPAYATPMLAMSQLGSMFQHANSIGAAFALLALGAGMNVGLLAWMIHSYGMKRALIWVVMLQVVVVGLAYGVENPLHRPEIEPAGHTHAFDVYCRPFQNDQGNLPNAVLGKLKQDTNFFEVWSTIALGGLLLMGLGLKAIGRRWDINEWLTRERVVSSLTGAASTQPVWSDRNVSAPVIGATILLGLVAFSVVGCYAFYPDKNEVFEEMSIAQAEALSAARGGDHAHAVFWIERWDEWTRKLQVGVFLREFELSAYHRMKARVLREKLELLKHEVEDDDREAAQEMATQVATAYRRMKAAYDEGG